MFKRSDYIIISIILFFFGIFAVSQYRASKVYLKVVTPENNATMALEVAKLTKSNSDLRMQVKNQTLDLETYKNSGQSKKDLYDKYNQDLQNLNIINGISGKTGQGVLVRVLGSLSAPQLIDLVNAIKNIGFDTMSINGQRIMVNTDLSRFSNQQNYEILVYGNSKLLKSAMERKGGIVDQIITKEIKINVEEKEQVAIPLGEQIVFQYSKSVNN